MDGALSCDTSVAVGTATRDGSVIFAKNSDRPANECQPLTHVARRRHPADATLKCQYLAIPQVAETWEMIGSRPYWLWGFEMGVNEWGVAIGNEAVLSREPYEERALIGMDLVRLGLERGRTAHEAVRVIATLVEEYGQGGSCDATTFRTYHNSFIAADPRGAWILETAGRRWAARHVRDRAAISNLYTIEREWDAASPGVVAHACAHGWGDEPFSFAAAYQDPAADLRPRACRLDRARAILGGHRAPIGVEDMQALLRDHDGGDLPDGPRDLPTICMHVAPGSGGETAAALVAHLRPDRPRELAVTAWTAFGSPCLSVFRPVYPFAVGLPAELDRGGPTDDPASPWWAFERLQRTVAQAPALAPLARAALGDLEARFRQEAAATEAEAATLLAHGDRDAALGALRALVDDTTARALALARRLAADLAARAAEAANPAMADAWRDLNAAAGLAPAAALAPAAGK
ncbi:MAG TPA: C69 family dipeptidase [Thermomicrobiales bacterium]|nr:C69 family dipeptidase [Thermomicrobiales bacterium]